jgi:hypothetical protein
MDMGSETMLGFWFGVVMSIMCLVCAMPDLLKDKARARQERGAVTGSSAYRSIAKSTSQLATADTQITRWEGQEPEFVLAIPARHCVEQEGHGVTECLRQQVSPGIDASRSKACAGHLGLRVHESHIPIENALCSLSVGE